MKKNLCKIMMMLLAAVLILTACGSQDTAEKIIKKQLTSGVWYADMSLGTTAGYTFSKDGSFTCETAVTLEGEHAELTRGGSYEILTEGENVTVYLAFEGAGYLVEIVCTANGDNYDFVIAGCTMYQA